MKGTHLFCSAGLDMFGLNSDMQLIYILCMKILEEKKIKATNCGVLC